MRNLGYSSLLLTASLVVTSACSKKDESSGDTAAKKDDGGAKVDDKKTGDAGKAGGGTADVKTDAVKAPEQPTGGIAATATQLAAVGTPAAALALIPDQAQFILGLSVGSIMSSPFYKLAEAEMNADPEVQKMLTTVKDCGLDPNKLENVVVGIHTDENFVIVMVGEGLGEDQKAQCLLSKLQESAGEGTAGQVVTENGKKSIQFSKGRAYLVDGRTLALTTTAWDSALVSLMDGQGSPAVSNSKKDLFAKVNTNASMWGVATIPAELAGMAPMLGAPAEFASVQSVTGSLDLSTGAAVNVVAGFTSEDAAKSVTTQLQALLAEASKSSPELSSLSQTVKIEAAGTDVKVAMSASAEEMAKIQAAAPI
jgi:hypothetical protein